MKRIRFILKRIVVFLAHIAIRQVWSIFTKNRVEVLTLLIIWQKILFSSITVVVLVHLSDHLVFLFIIFCWSFNKLGKSRTFIHAFCILVRKYNSKNLLECQDDGPQDYCLKLKEKNLCSLGYLGAIYCLKTCRLCGIHLDEE